MDKLQIESQSFVVYIVDPVLWTPRRDLDAETSLLQAALPVLTNTQLNVFSYTSPLYTDPS